MSNIRPTIFLQTDRRWKYKRYATQYENSTVGGSGCGPTAVAMAISTWVDKSVTPYTCCLWSMKHGFKATGCGTYHSYVVAQARAYGLECEKLNNNSIRYMSSSEAEKYHKKAHDAVDNGCYVVCLMGKGNWTRGGHYILWWGNSGNNVLINDPNSRASYREKSSFSLLKSQVRIYWVIKPPKEVISVTRNEIVSLINTSVKNAIKNIDTNHVDNNPNPSDWAKDSWEHMSSVIGRDGKHIFDGTRPREFVSREEAALLLYRLGLGNRMDYRTSEDKDDKLNIPSDWATDAWKALSEKTGSDGKKVIDGTRPFDNISRQEVAVILDRLLNNAQCDNED